MLELTQKVLLSDNYCVTQAHELQDDFPLKDIIQQINGHKTEEELYAEQMGLLAEARANVERDQFEDVAEV